MLTPRRIGRKSVSSRSWNWPSGGGDEYGKRFRSFCVCSKHNTVLSPQKNLRRSLNSNDWIRVDFHAHRVKVFSCSDFYSYRRMAFVDPQIFQALALRYREVSSFLPSLFDLSWDVDKLVYPYISLFLGPQITKLSLCVPRLSNIPSPDVIASIKERSPFIRHMWINQPYQVYRHDLIALVSDVLE
jgi:hypothetical protein